MFRFLVVVALSGISGFLLLTVVPSSEAVAEIGKATCFLFVNFTDAFGEAHHQCREKMEKENKGNNDKERKEEHKRHPPHNATIEEFEWDDKCMEHCVYTTAGILSSEDTLPDKKDTTTLFAKGKVSDSRYEIITDAWNECLDLSPKIGKEKGWNICKIVTHNQHCFFSKMGQAISKLEIDC